MSSEKDKGDKIDDFVAFERLLASGEANAIAWGTQFIANPDLPLRLELDAPLDAPDLSIFYADGPQGYVDYPALVHHPCLRWRERKSNHLKSNHLVKRIQLSIGAAP